jgi:hypothetical protein
MSTSSDSWAVLRNELLTLDQPAEHAIEERPCVAEHCMSRLADSNWQLLADAGSSVVFGEPSGCWVLKLLKTPHGVVRKFRDVWGSSRLGGSSWTPFPGDDLRSAEYKVGRTLASIAFAGASIPYETATVCTHLQPDARDVEVQLHGESMNVRSLPFFVQVRVEPLEVRLAGLIDEVRLEAAQAALEDFLHYVTRCWERGFTDTPFNFSQNYGYVREVDIERFVQFDIGDFRFGDAAVRHEITDKAVLRSYSYRWLQHRSPDLAAYLFERVHDVFDHALHSR